MQIESLFPVQMAVWLETIGPGGFERDICVNSPTGSGKTLAYALPIVQSLSTRKIKCLRALVVLPTRDLALQVHSITVPVLSALSVMMDFESSFVVICGLIRCSGFSNARCFLSVSSLVWYQPCVSPWFYSSLYELSCINPVR